MQEEGTDLQFQIYGSPFLAIKIKTISNLLRKKTVDQNIQNMKTYCVTVKIYQKILDLKNLTYHSILNAY